MKKIKFVLFMAGISLVLALTLSLGACGGDDPKSLAKQSVELGKDMINGNELDPKLLKKMADIEKKINNLSEEDKQIYITEYTNLLFNHVNKGVK